MTIELDNLIEVLDKIQDAGNLTAIQEETLLHIHNAAVEYHVAKTGEDKTSALIGLDATASIDGERAASLNRSTQKVLADLHGCLNDLIAETSDGEDPTSSLETMRAVRNMLIKGSHKLTGKADDDMSFIDAAIDMLNEQLPDFGGQAFQEANNEQ